MSFAFLLTPVLAQASALSIFESFFGQTADASTAQSGGFNSQTVPLLAAAVNLDPNPAVGGGDIDVVDGSALAAQEGPNGTVADIAEQPSSSQISVYTVREGDTLSQIAAMFDVDTKTILGANDIPGGIIHPGETLIILPIVGIEHTVVSGDTLASLAKKYGSNAQDIAQYNGLDDTAPLAVDTTLLIPGGELAAPTPTPTTTSTSHSTTIQKIAAGATEPYLGGSGPAIAGYYAAPIHGIITQGLHGWNAVDIAAPTGTPIHAAAAGTVIVANDSGGWNGGYGNYVVIEHPNGTQTLYAHMSRVLTTAGSSVAQGDVIGKVGQTGEATGPHVHFEVRGAANPFASLAVGTSL